MLSLEDKIAEWRKRMAAGGVKAPAVLDELENHLREDMERQIRADKNVERAFETAVDRIGRSDLLKAEFAKVAEMKDGRLGKMIGIACCVFAGLYSMLLAPHLFTIHELSPAQRFMGLTAVALTFLSTVSWRFSYKYLPVIRNRRTRTIAVVACGLGGLAWLLVFANLLPNVVVPHFMGGAAWVESIRGMHSVGVNTLRAERHVLIGLRQATPEGLRPVFMIGLSFLWAMTLAAILGGVAYGLEEAAHRQYRKDAYV